ncbi:hypothetical protein A2714_01660 [Candidatus Woesebacteria bacterium RIFCSPHIGHO2_01_FULL_38_9]|uniref:Glutamyl-tRNA amidotransferase n=1 Tax=Candidatus Woesebacteria bacterium RIFCSPHIGHO2_01_FULL_38_9 TaxID=1802492 RepID=A0A1F7XZD5_9BACT|nr:MAG: hypothetical protein A2714_01660 [Candidatus Woesebacteria bacterium RIFCSPHIGHO2_01_FULL_38_9]
MISETINQKIAEAMKARDEILLSTLRMLSSALNYEKIAKQHDLSEEEEIAVVKKEAKKRLDAISSIKEAEGKNTTSDKGVLEKRLEQESKELEILKSYLPEELPNEDLEKIVNEAIQEVGASSLAEFGRVMGVAMKKTGGRVDGTKVAELVKNKLS